MRAKPLWSSTDGWRLLFESADTLLSLSFLHDQIEYIQDRLTEIIGFPVEIFLTEEFKPLPHLKNVAVKGNPSHLKLIDITQCVEEIQIRNDPENLYAIIPVKNPGQLLGNLQIRFPKKFEISNEQKQFLLSVGGYLGKIFELSRLKTLKNWRKEQLELVRSVNKEIVQLREPHLLFSRIVELIQSTFRFFFVALYTADETSNCLIYRSSAGLALTENQLSTLAGSDGIQIGEGLIGKCAESRQECFDEVEFEKANNRRVHGLENTQSELCLPLVIGEKILGVLQILGDKPTRFHENDILVLRILSDNVALAIQNAGLIDDLLEQAWLSTMMLQVSESSQRLDNVEDLINEVSRIIPLLIGVQKCGIFLRDERSGEFILNAHYGFEKREEAALAMLPFGNESGKIFSQMAESKSPLPFVNQIFSSDKQKRKTGNLCCGLIPMVAHEKVFGAIIVDDLGAAHGEESMVSKADALLAVGRQTALAVENLRLEESSENESYINAVLLQVAEMVAASSDLNETIESIVSFLPFVVGVDTAFVYLFDESHQRFHLNAKLSSQWKNQLIRLPISIRSTPRNALVQMQESAIPFFYRVSGQPIETWLQVQPQDSLADSDILTDPEPLLLVVPLFILDEKCGLLFVLESEKGFEFRSRKAEIITGIARHLSLAIHSERLKKEMINQERVQREFQLAREIQQTFLPDVLPYRHGWEISAHWRPALQVGGDFYDAFFLDNRRIGLVIADVSNKGFPAALYMTVARTLIHAEALEGDPPVETLGRVNRLLLANSQKGLFVTCLYAIVDTESGDLTYANSGHNKPLWLRKSRGKVEWLAKGGMPLGVAEELELEDLPLQIKKGDYLLFYTDGVTDAQAPDGSFFGEERLFNVMNVYKDIPFPSLIETVDGKIAEYRADAPPADDLTLLVLQRLP